MLSDWNLVQPLSAVTESFGYDEMMQDTNGQSWSQAMQAISDPAMGLEDVFDSVRAIHTVFSVSILLLTSMTVNIGMEWPVKP